MWKNRGHSWTSCQEKTFFVESPIGSRYSLSLHLFKFKLNVKPIPLRTMRIFLSCLVCRHFRQNMSEQNGMCDIFVFIMVSIVQIASWKRIAFLRIGWFSNLVFPTNSKKEHSETNDLPWLSIKFITSKIWLSFNDQ